MKLDNEEYQDKEGNLQSRLARRDQIWAAMRPCRDYLELLSTAQKPTFLDFLLSYICIRIVLQEIEFYSHQLIDIPKETRDLMKDNSAAGILIRTNEEAKNIKIIEDSQTTIDDKQQAINDIRMSIWGNLVYCKEPLSELVGRWPSMENKEDIFLLFQCVSAVIMELDLCDIEITMLRDDY